MSGDARLSTAVLMGLTGILILLRGHILSLIWAHMREQAREQCGGVSGELPGVAYVPYPGRPVGPALFHLRYHDPITLNCACAFYLVKRL